MSKKISKTSAAAFKAWATRRRMAKEAEAAKAARRAKRAASKVTAAA